MSTHTTPGGINPRPRTAEDNLQNWQRFSQFATAGAVGVDPSTGALTIATALGWTVSSSGVIAKTAWTATWAGGVAGGNITQTYDGIYTAGFVAGSPANNHFVVDLHANYTLSRVTITSQATTVIPTSYTIEVSPDNVNWTSVTNNLIATVITDYFFPSPIANMRYVRITPNSGTANGNWFVNELDIYGGGVGAATIITGSPTVGVSAGSIIRISGAFKKNASTDDWYCQLGDSTGANGYRVIWTAGGVLKIQSVNANTPTDIGSNVNLTSDTALHYFNAVILVAAFNDASIVAQVDGNAACHVDNDSHFNLTAAAGTVVVFTGDASKLWGFGYTTSKTVNGPTGSYPLTASSVPSTLGNTTIPTLTITGSIVYPAQVANTFWGGPATGANATPTFRALVAADIPGTLGNTTIGNLTISGTHTNATDGNTSGAMTFKNVSTAIVPLTVNCPAFTTANLTEWYQNGIIKAWITSAGLLNVTGLTVSGSVQGAITFAGNILAQGNLTLQGTGNFTNVPTLPNQSNATIFAGPATGAAATPAFRAMAATDLPGGNWIGSSNGETTMAAPFTLNTNATYSNTGLTVSLPAAGTYRVEGQVRASMGTSMTSAFVTAKLFNATAAADVANSTVLVAILPTPQATAYLGSVVTVAAATTLALYAQLTFTGTLAPTQIQSDSNGWTKLAFTRIA